MAIYINVVQEFRKELETGLALNDIVDDLISEKLIDEKLYAEIWTHQNDQINCLLDLIVKDGKRCAKFIGMLGTVSHMKNISDSIKDSIDKICQMIVIGGFPEFSLNYVVRNSVADRIKEKALELDPKFCSTLVVHGLPGFGKSCLVNQVLQTKRFLETSGGAMFWINLGEHSDTTAVINPLWSLYLTAVKLTNHVALTHRPEDIVVLQNEVKKIFLDEKLANAYIILDDVKSAEVLDVFKLRCKIIVTTQDKNVANDFQAFFVKVTTGFTKKESLELLRKSLETDSLCAKETFANKIHELCDGCPMLLNIIGSILKDSREEALSTDIIWDSIIHEIVENDYLPHPTTEKVIHMIKRFVSCLNQKIQKYFHSLAVFPKHVNIRPEILMKLWDEKYYAVRQIMVELENKSLIVSFYNKDLKTYIYSIHSLVRTYLVERADVDIKFYHKKLISECQDVINKAPPDDSIANYIFGYYGYHAKHAELYDKFEKFFDLRFIENKIKRCGSADLLTDFDTYRDLITKKEPRLERKLNDYIKFVNAYSAHLHISPETNIIQFAFFHDNNCVYEEARNIASNNPDHLYFKLEPYSDAHKNFPSLKTKSTATSTCFVNSKEVVVGTYSGSIEIKSFHQYQQKVQHFEGHTDQVFSVQLSPDGKSFLSISLDRTAKLWKFTEELDPQSPKLKQIHWKNLHSPDENIESYKTFKMQDKDYIISAAFPYDGSDEIVTASKNGKITRWNIKTAAIIRESALGLPISHISYVHDSQQIIFSYDGKIYNYVRDKLLYNGQFALLEDITNLILIPAFSDLKEVAVVTATKFEVWEYRHKVKRFAFEANSKITSAVVNSDYLVLGGDSCIYVYNYKLQHVISYNNDYGGPRSLYILPNLVVFILIDKERVQRCELHLESSEKPLIQDLSHFSCYWKDSLPIYFTVNTENKIDIFHGHSTILSVIEIVDKVTFGTFSLCGNYLILGTRTGKIYFYNYKKKKISEITVSDGGISLIKCFESDIDRVDSYYDSADMYGRVVAASNKKIVILVDKKPVIELDISQELSDIFCLRNLLITIDVDGKFAVARIFEDKCFGWVSGLYEDVILATVHKEKNFLAIVCKEGKEHVLRVIVLDDVATMKVIFHSRVCSEPKCLCFSSSGKLLAAGCKNGDIRIFNLENNAQDVMALHKRSVERLLFAPNFESILVSVGDQIAWWNLNSFQEQSEAKALNSHLDSHQLRVFTFDPWKDKKLHDTVPYLLTSTNLHGKHLRYISASKDFRSFLVVDVDGNIFKMDIINL
ncbi:hypothetical protein Zmor_001746 [Zophobas morio]|uniref:Apoptotic protease-activating factor 1 n=1 Tax=Zophobas morio TaxID=2755281 RepID=A0AA38J2I5_9CUCU|nr:hypothetical protein Zmor_001746 [Zophobas morio]